MNEEDEPVREVDGQDQFSNSSGMNDEKEPFIKVIAQKENTKLILKDIGRFTDEKLDDCTEMLQDVKLEIPLGSEAKNTEELVGLKYKHIELFEVTQQVMVACYRSRIQKIAELKEKYTILNEIDALKPIRKMKITEKNVLPEELIVEDKDKILMDQPSKEDAKKFTREFTQEFINSVRSEILTKFSARCEEEKSDLLFFAAASLNIETIKNIIKSCNLRETRRWDSVLVFVLKYANFYDPRFDECIEILLNERIDVNIPDFDGIFAIDRVCGFFNNTKTDPKMADRWKTLCSKLLEQGVTDEFMNPHTKKFKKDLQYDDDLRKQSLESNKSCIKKHTLFFLITQEDKRFRDRKIKDTRKQLELKEKKCEDFKRFFEDAEFDVNDDSYESTLLQFVCQKSQAMEMQKFVEYLLEKGAQSNKVTKINIITPLALAAQKNHKNIFEILLNRNDLEITEGTFRVVVKYCAPIAKKRDILKRLLESDKLNPRFTHENGITALQYAVQYSYPKAIQNLLTRARYVLPDDNQHLNNIFDMIKSDDLQKYFNFCIASDIYASHAFQTDYKMLLRFNLFITTKSNTQDEKDEISFIQKICKNENVRNVLLHPLTTCYVDLKWQKVQSYFWTFMAIQLILFLSLGASLYLSKDSETAFVFVIILTIINTIFKGALFINIDKSLMFLKVFELILSITLFGFCIFSSLKAFACIEMSIIFLLSACFHPGISKWSQMLQTAITTFIKLMLFFSIIIIACAISFYMLFSPENGKHFGSIFKSIFMTYVMTAGEFGTTEVKFQASDFWQYLLFFIFVMFVHMVIANFWIGVAVSDIERLQKDADVNALENVIDFIASIERNIYPTSICKRLLPSPLLFWKEATETRKKYEADFYIYRDNQFGNLKNFPKNVSKNVAKKIKQLILRRQEIDQEEQKL